MNNTFFSVCMAWKADKRPWVKPATYATYNILINSHLAPYFGPIPPSALSEQNVQAYVNAELEKGLSVKTIRAASGPSPTSLSASPSPANGAGPCRCSRNTTVRCCSGSWRHTPRPGTWGF